MLASLLFHRLVQLCKRQHAAQTMLVRHRPCASFAVYRSRGMANTDRCLQAWCFGPETVCYRYQILTRPRARRQMNPVLMLEGFVNWLFLKAA
jgi:hypothetical protein